MKDLVIKTVDSGHDGRAPLGHVVDVGGDGPALCVSRRMADVLDSLDIRSARQLLSYLSSFGMEFAQSIGLSSEDFESAVRDLRAEVGRLIPVSDGSRQRRRPQFGARFPKGGHPAADEGRD